MFISIADVLRKAPHRELLDNQRRDPDANGLYNRNGNAFTDAIIGHFEQQQILINKNKCYERTKFKVFER